MTKRLVGPMLSCAMWLRSGLNSCFASCRMLCRRITFKTSIQWNVRKMFSLLIWDSSSRFWSSWMSLPKFSGTSLGGSGFFLTKYLLLWNPLWNRCVKNGNSWWWLNKTLSYMGSTLSIKCLFFDGMYTVKSWRWLKKGDGWLHKIWWIWPKHGFLTPAQLWDVKIRFEHCAWQRPDIKTTRKFAQKSFKLLPSSRSMRGTKSSNWPSSSPVTTMGFDLVRTWNGPCLIAAVLVPMTLG